MAAENLVHFNDLNWDEEVTQVQRPRARGLHRRLVRPLQGALPIIQKLSDELAGKVKVGKLDIDESPGHQRQVRHPRRAHGDGLRGR